jgi:hypothetical protein
MSKFKNDMAAFKENTLYDIKKIKSSISYIEKELFGMDLNGGRIEVGQTEIDKLKESLKRTTDFVNTELSFEKKLQNIREINSGNVAIGKLQETVRKQELVIKALCDRLGVEIVNREDRPEIELVKKEAKKQN